LLASITRTREPSVQCCEFVGRTSAMMTIAGMGSLALAGIIVDFFR
jgi:hypothetical protein